MINNNRSKTIKFNRKNDRKNLAKEFDELKKNVRLFPKSPELENNSKKFENVPLNLRTIALKKTNSKSKFKIEIENNNLRQKLKKFEKINETLKVENKILNTKNQHINKFNLKERDKIRKGIEKEGKLHENEIQKLSAQLEQSQEDITNYKENFSDNKNTKYKKQISELEKKLGKALASTKIQKNKIKCLKHVNSNLTNNIKLLKKNSIEDNEQLVNKYKQEKSNVGTFDNKLMLLKLKSIQNLKNKLEKKEEKLKKYSQTFKIQKLEILQLKHLKEENFQIINENAQLNENLNINKETLCKERKALKLIKIKNYKQKIKIKILTNETNKVKFLTKTIHFTKQQTFNLRKSFAEKEQIINNIQKILKEREIKSKHLQDTMTNLLQNIDKKQLKCETKIRKYSGTRKKFYKEKIKELKQGNIELKLKIKYITKEKKIETFNNKVEIESINQENIDLRMKMESINQEKIKLKIKIKSMNQENHEQKIKVNCNDEIRNQIKNLQIYQKKINKFINDIETKNKNEMVKSNKRINQLGKKLTRLEMLVKMHSDSFQEIMQSQNIEFAETKWKDCITILINQFQENDSYIENFENTIKTILFSIQKKEIELKSMFEKHSKLAKLFSENEKNENLQARKLKNKIESLINEFQVNDSYLQNLGEKIEKIISVECNQTMVENKLKQKTLNIKNKFKYNLLFQNKQTKTIIKQFEHQIRIFSKSINSLYIKFKQVSYILSKNETQLTNIIFKFENSMKKANKMKSKNELKNKKNIVLQMKNEIKILETKINNLKKEGERTNIGGQEKRYWKMRFRSLTFRERKTMKHFESFKTKIIFQNEEIKSLKHIANKQHEEIKSNKKIIDENVKEINQLANENFKFKSFRETIENKLEISQAHELKIETWSKNMLQENKIFKNHKSQIKLLSTKLCIHEQNLEQYVTDFQHVIEKVKSINHTELENVLANIANIVSQETNIIDNLNHKQTPYLCFKKVQNEIKLLILKIQGKIICDEKVQKKIQEEKEHLWLCQKEIITLETKLKLKDYYVKKSSNIYYYLSFIFFTLFIFVSLDTLDLNFL